ncbi:MAG TPA: site-2 protease family protein, partial [Lacipirellulaceae bacterium]|nr:site-2 protease family protein [Lacipirellulaceae bacterium]
PGGEAPRPAAPRADSSAPPRPARPATDDPFHDPELAHLPELRPSHLRGMPPAALRDYDVGMLPQRRVMLPLMLFLATCASTFWVGVTHWDPLRTEYSRSWALIARTVAANWDTGLEYMVAVLAILLTHEMGHFLQTVKYRIPASYPLCIPVPFNPIGTMGAVIGMDGMRADRRQIFDIGIAGPLAGLVVAVPVFWLGIQRLDLSGGAPPNEVEFYLPLIGQWMLAWAHPGAEWSREQWVPLSQLNPLFMAGWVGMLITGLNMLPISQLDGGHTMYALFLDRAHSFARAFISFAILYVVINLDDAVLWTPMLLLVIFLGIHHPPTANDNVELGRVRHAVGLASLAIPVLCFPLLGVRQ